MDSRTEAPPVREAQLVEFFRALADADRLRIVGRLAEGPATLPKLAGDLRISSRDCARHLTLLTSLGLVDEENTRAPALYRFSERWLRETSQAILDSPRSRALNGATDDRSRALASFFRDGRLLSIPTGDVRKEIVLTEIAGAFEAKRTYSEREVNAILKAIYPYDFVTLRRLLVDFRYLNRSNSVYWIGEGRRDPDAAALPLPEAVGGLLR
jgi:hypothetical protein